MKIFPKSISSHITVHLFREGRARTERDWLLLIIIGIGILVIEIMWSMFFFHDNIVVHAPVHMTTISTTAIDKNAVQNAQAVFGKRASVQSAYESDATAIADPSK